MASKIIAYPNSSGLQLVPDSSGGLEIYVNGTTLVAAISAAGVFTTSLSSADLVSFMAASVQIGVGTANLCNTGSIGAAGQVWGLLGVALIGTTDGTTSTAGVSIYDGSSVIANGGGVVYPGGNANWPATQVCYAQPTLTGATTFTLRGHGNQTNCYAFQAGYGGSLTTACFISARRIK